MSDTGDPILRFFGGLLLAIGLLIATVSGFCTVAALSSNSSGMLSIMVPPLIVGIVLIALGVAMLYAK